MELINFDDHFSDYAAAWAEKNRGRYKRPEDMEEELPGVYLQFLNTPVSWLDGASPGDYFDRFQSAGELCDLLCRYAAADVPVPDPLLCRLVTLSDEAALLAMTLNRSAPPEARMHGVSLLRQLESRAPMVDFIRWQVERAEDEELLDNALESLKAMGQEALRPVRLAFQAAETEGREALLDILCDYPAEDDVIAFALERFESQRKRRALFAGYLAKLGDDRALEPLLDAAESADVDYVDFIEIRSAIERLGGEAPVRDFSRDPAYRAVRRLQ